MGHKSFWRRWRNGRLHLTLAMTLVFSLSPLVGFLCDRLKRRMPFLLVLTLCWIVSTVLIGTWGLKLSLLLVATALVFIQLANIFYNGLLGDLSTNGNAGLIVGIGVGLGYIGAITSSCYVNFTFGGWRPCKSFSTDGFLFTGFYCTVTCCRQISD